MTFGGLDANIKPVMVMDKIIDERKIYELGYLLVPYLPAEEVGKNVDSLIKANSSW